MKRKLAPILMMLILAVSLAGCAKDASKMIYLKDIDVEKYVTLGEYKGVHVTLDEPVVTDEEIENFTSYILQNSPVLVPITDRTVVQTGDIANIDYAGKVDGVAFEGGTAQGHNLTIGSGQFIPGFEDGVNGMQVGETKDVTATFPDPYSNNPALAGKEAVFTVTVNSINTQEIPELTDEYVAGLEQEGLATVEDFNNLVRETLMSEKQAQYADSKENQLVEAVESSTTFQEIPEGIVTRMNDMLTSNLTSYAQSQGMDLATYVASAYGGSADAYETILKQQATTVAKQYMMLEAIARKEGLIKTDAELEAIIAQEATEGGYATVDEYKAVMDVDAYKEFLMTRDVVTFLTENAVIEPTAQAETTEAAQ